MAKRILITGLIVSILAFVGLFIRERLLLQNEILDGLRLRSHLLREKMVSARVIVSAMKTNMVQNLTLAQSENYQHPDLTAITYYPRYDVYGLEPDATQTIMVRNATLTGSGRFENVDLARAIARGDDALYAAKNKGRNRVVALNFT
jgi:hypothetical protein